MANSRIYIVFLIVFTTCFSCKKEEKSVKKTTHNTASYDTVPLPKLTGLKPNLRLTPKAKAVTQDWVFYNEVTRHLNSLGKGTIGHTRHYTHLLDKTYTALQEKQKEEMVVIPSQLTTQPIQARLVALETQIRVLKNEVVKTKPSAQRIATAIVRSKNALQDLNLQIDERFSLSIEEILKAANETSETLDTNNIEQTTLYKLGNN